MSKVIIFNASPREKGYVSQLLEEVAKGAAAAGAEIVSVDLNDPGIKGCQACFYCRRNEGCATEDNLQPVYQHLKDADAIVFGSPIFWRSISGQGKQLMDRLFPMVDGKMQPRYPGKKLLTVFAQGQPDAEKFSRDIRVVNGILSSFGWELTDSLLCYGTNMLKGAPPEADLLKRAHDCGAALA